MLEQKLESAIPAVTPELDIEQVWHTGRRRRTRRRAMVSSSVVALVAVAAAGVVLAVNDDNAAQVATTPSPAPTERVVRNELAKVEFTIPSSWTSTTEGLTSLTDPIDALAAATFDLRSTANASCPENAFADLGPTDALVAVWAWTGPPSPVARSRYEDFKALFVDPPPFLCRDYATDGDANIAMFTEGGRQFSVIVALGDDVSPEREAEAWAILDSLVVGE
jgi:hypothetical protein